MQPLAVRIEGDFWDVQIYRGRLYLWRMDGSLAVYDWDRLVGEHLATGDDSLALGLALARGDVLYASPESYLFRHGSFRRFMTDQFDDAANLERAISTTDIERYVLGRQDNPFRSLPSDTDIYASVLYAVDDEGLWSTSAHRGNTRYRVGSRPKKMSDVASFSVKAKAQRLALAAGDEGLLEYDLTFDSPWRVVQGQPPQKVDHHAVRLDERHCSQAEWSYSSIFASSHIGPGYLVGFRWEHPDGDAANVIDAQDEIFDFVGGKRDRQRYLAYVGTTEDDAIFEGLDIGDVRYSWGCLDKIYASSGDRIFALRFTQNKLGMDHSAFEPLETRPFDSAPVVSAGVSFFGTVLETDDHLAVLQADGHTTNIAGPITRWRVYPRSIRYENHLHIILDDCLLILAFTSDYFADQEEKVFGAKYSPPSPRSRGSR